MKFHLFVIIAIVSGFSTFMTGYSLPPFLEVGFGGADVSSTGEAGDSEAELMKQFEELYQQAEE